MRARAELLAKYEAWEAAQTAKREAAKVERKARRVVPPVDRAGYQDQLREVWAKPEPTPWDELSPEQPGALKQLRGAAGDPVISGRSDVSVVLRPAVGPIWGTASVG
jgi:hypothetical protein